MTSDSTERTPTQQNSGTAIHPVAPPAGPVILDLALIAGPVWVVSPHPDDESLGCGSLLARLTDLGTEVWALLISDGSGSHPGSQAWPKERLVQQRSGEWHGSLDVLGMAPDRRVSLALPDGQVPMPGWPGGQRAVQAVRDALSRRPPATVLLPWRRDPHPDHRATHALVQAALQSWPDVRMLEYTVWLAERGTAADAPQPGEATQWTVPVQAQLARKEAAIRCHVSQLAPELGGLIFDDPGGFVLQEEMILRSLTQTERLLEVRE